MTITLEHLSCVEVARAYKAAKTKATKAEIRTHVAERAAKSRYKRWTKLLAAIDTGDNARLTYRAATGDEKKAALAAVKAAAKPKASKPAAKPSRKAPAKPKADADPLAAMAKDLGIPADKLEAFAAFVDLIRK
jgi:hypothetical protein